MRYDVHAHVVPISLTDRLSADGGRCGVTAADDDGRLRIAVGDDGGTPVRPDLLDVDARLSAMDRAGVDVQLLSAWIALTAYTLPDEQGIAWSRLFNETMAETVASRPDRFRGWPPCRCRQATQPLPSWSTPSATLGMVGVQIATTVAGRELDDDLFAAFWAAAERLRAIVVIHPDQVLPGRPRSRYVLSNFVGNAAETTIAASHLVFGGVLERHPDLRVCLVHGGGYAPYQAARMDHGYEAEPRLVDRRISQPPSHYLRKFYFDTVTHSPEVTRFLIDFAGAGAGRARNRLPLRDGREGSGRPDRPGAGPGGDGSEADPRGQPRATARRGAARGGGVMSMTASIPVTDGHPHFSAEEMQRRHEALLAAAGEAGVSRVLSIGSNRNGSAVQWLTGWPVTRDGFVFTEAGVADTLLVGFYNHVPQARELARDAEVGYVGPVPVETVLETLAARGHQGAAVGPGGPGQRPPAPEPHRRRHRGRRPEPGVHQAPADQVRRGGGVAAPRRRALRRGHRRPDRVATQRSHRARALRPGRARLRPARRHHPHPLLRRHPDGSAFAGQPGAVPLGAHR